MLTSIPGSEAFSSSSPICGYGAYLLWLQELAEAPRGLPLLAVRTSAAGRLRPLSLLYAATRNAPVIGRPGVPQLFF